MDFARAEEECDFYLRIFETVRSVYDIAVEALGEVFTDRSGSGIFGLCRAHDRSVFCHGSFAFKNGDEDRPFTMKVTRAL